MARKAGIAVPLFCLYSRESVGIGEFGDLPLLVDFCKGSGQKVLQLLPLFELGPDHSPYNPISQFALEPAYISLRLVPGADQSKIKDQISKIKDTYQISNRVDWRIREAKVRTLREIFKNSPDLPEVSDFRKKNAYWVEDYLKIKGGDVFWVWVQCQLYRQLSAGHEYAKKQGVQLVGDLPYSVGRKSADFLARPEFFGADFDLGAPPDLYSVLGQRWGTLPYNFSALASDNYRFLTERLRYLENFFDILRLDHVLGYFRQWRIDKSESRRSEGLHGSYDLKREVDWQERGEKLLQMFRKATRMELLAEDLGMTPPGVRESLARMNIPGADVARWTREYRKQAVAMLSLHDTSNFPAWWNDEAGTVDRQLWEYYCRKLRVNISEIEEKLFDLRASASGRLRWKEELDSEKKLIETIELSQRKIPHLVQMYKDSYGEKERWWKRFAMKREVAKCWTKELLAKALESTLTAPSVMAVNSLIDWLFLAETLSGDPSKIRINVPGTVSPSNWTFRLPVSLEELGNSGVSGVIREMTEGASRK